MIRVVRDLRPEQPLVFAIAGRWDPPPLRHALSDARVTRCIVTQPTPVGSDLDVFETRAGEHHLELELDGPGPTRVLACAPDLPLTLRW